MAVRNREHQAHRRDQLGFGHLFSMTLVNLSMILTSLANRISVSDIAVLLPPSSCSIEGSALPAKTLSPGSVCLAADKSRTLAMAVALDIARRPKATPVHELERYIRCKDCSQVRGYPYKRSHLVALRATKITASDPPSTWWRASD